MKRNAINMRFAFSLQECSRRRRNDSVTLDSDAAAAAADAAAVVVVVDVSMLIKPCLFVFLLIFA